MPPAAIRWLPRAAVAVLLTAAAFLAWRTGGGADARIPPPRAGDVSPPSDAGAHAAGAEAYEVTARLSSSSATHVGRLANLAAAQPYFAGAWRKLRGPWAHPGGAGGDLAYTLAIRTSRSSQRQWSVGTSDGGAWVPQARVWNMNEGSVRSARVHLRAYARDASVALAQSLPRARFRASPGLATPLPAATLFDVVLVDRGGAEHPVSHTRIAADRAVERYRRDSRPGAGSVWTSSCGRAPTSLCPMRNATRDRLGKSSDSTGDSRGGPAPPMSLALWGDPTVVTLQPTRLPYDSSGSSSTPSAPTRAPRCTTRARRRGDRAAPRPPLEALLPAIPGLLPSIDALAGRGVHFQHAWSAAAWTRPGTLAMLTGERSSELGVDTLSWVLSPDKVARFYASDPPLLPRVLRRSGAVTPALVNNSYSGYVAVSVTWA